MRGQAPSATANVRQGRSSYCLGIEDQDVKVNKVKEIIVGFKMRDDDC